MAKSTRQTFEIGDRVYFRRTPKGALEPGTVAALGSKVSYYSGRDIPAVHVTPEPDASRWGVDTDGTYRTENRRDLVLHEAAGREEYERFQAAKAERNAADAEAARRWEAFAATPLGAMLVDVAGDTRITRQEFYGIVANICQRYPAVERAVRPGATQ